MKASAALIVGSGLAMANVAIDWGEFAQTPYGRTTSPLGTLTTSAGPVLVIARHGPGHKVAPHEVNYRANIWALRTAGVGIAIGINIVGGIAPGFRPGDLAVPEQLIDYTSGREMTFGDIGAGIPHIDFTVPFDAELAGRLAEAAAALGVPPQRGVYGVTQGPRLETAAEIRRLERDGCAMVGMTAMPEASLAREAGLRYAILAASVNYAAGLSPAGTPIHAELAATAATAMERMFDVVDRVAGSLNAKV